jgi:flagellar biosynthesis protein FlhG
MDWKQARKRLRSLAVDGDPESLEGSPGGRVPEPAARVRERDVRHEPGARAASVCIASGKGGTGKSVVSAALARLASAHGRTLLFDADLGVGNAHILQDVSPARTLVDVVEGRVSVSGVRESCAEGLDLVAAGSGVPRMTYLSSYELHLIAHGVSELERDYAYVVVDSAAGISHQTLAFAEASDAVLVVTTPDLTAMTDAYAFLKVLFVRRPDVQAFFVVNRAEDEEEAERVHERIADVTTRFLRREPRFLGWIPQDPAVVRAVNHRASVISAEPDAPAARALRVLGARVLRELGSVEPQGLGRMLVRQIGLAGDAV